MAKLPKQPKTVVDVLIQSLVNDASKWSKHYSDEYHYVEPAKKSNGNPFTSNFRLDGDEKVRIHLGSFLNEPTRVEVGKRELKLSWSERSRIKSAVKNWERNPEGSRALIEMLDQMNNSSMISKDDLVEELKYMIQACPEHAMLSKHQFVRELASRIKKNNPV